MGCYLGLDIEGGVGMSEMCVCVEGEAVVTGVLRMGSVTWKSLLQVVFE